MLLTYWVAFSPIVLVINTLFMLSFENTKKSEIKADVERQSDAGGQSWHSTIRRYGTRTRSMHTGKQFNFHWEFYTAVRCKEATSLRSLNQWLTQTLEIMCIDTCVLSARWTGLLRPRRFTLTVLSSLKHLIHCSPTTSPSPASHSSQLNGNKNKESWCCFCSSCSVGSII